MGEQLNKGYYTVSFHKALRDQVAITLECWKVFLAQPEEQKQQFQLETPGGGHMSSKDSKEVFDISYTFFTHQIILSNKSSESHLFLLHSRELLRLCYDAVEELGTILTAESGIECTKQMRASVDHWILRCAYYPPQSLVQIFAPEKEKYLATIVLHQSDAVLQYNEAGEWKEILFTEITRPCFLGIEAGYVGKGTVGIASRRVVRTPENNEKGRYSIELLIPSLSQAEHQLSLGKLGNASQAR